MVDKFVWLIQQIQKFVLFIVDIVRRVRKIVNSDY